MKKLLSLLIAFTLLVSCSSDENPMPAPIVKYIVTLSAGEGGAVSTTGGEYESGQTVSVTATPNENYVFAGWSDGYESSSRELIVLSNIDITANFMLKKYELTITIVGEGDVTEEVVGAGRTTEYSSGTTVKLTALALDGWKFDSWSEDITSVENPLTLLIDSSKNITANFIIDPEINSTALEVKSYVFNTVDENQKIISGYKPNNSTSKIVISKKTPQEAYNEINVLAQEARNFIIDEVNIHENLDLIFQELSQRGLDTISEYLNFQNKIAIASEIHQKAIEKRREIGQTILGLLNIEGINTDEINNIVLEPTREINYSLDYSGRSLNHLIQLIQLAVNSFELSNKDELNQILTENSEIYSKKDLLLSSPAQEISDVFNTKLPDDDRFDRIATFQEKVDYFDEFIENQEITVERFRLNYIKSVEVENQWDNYIDNLSFNFNKNFALTISGRERPKPEAGYRYSVENAWLRDAVYRYTEARFFLLYDDKYREIERIIGNWDGSGDNPPTRVDNLIRTLELYKNENALLGSKYPPVNIGDSDLDWPQYDSQFRLSDFREDLLILGLLSRKIEAEQYCNCVSIYDNNSNHDSGGSGHDSGGSGHDSGGSGHDSGGSGGGHDSGNNGGSSGQSGN